MRIIVQRVSQASVSVENETIAAIGQGLLLLVGFAAGDSEQQLAKAAAKAAALRVFPDARGRFQYSVRDVGGSVLAVPNFTVYGDARRGNRPDFGAALAPGPAGRLFDRFVDALRGAGVADVATGRFGAGMQVSLVNDGPVSVVLEF